MLTVKNLTYTYPEEKTPAIRDVSFTVKRGEIVLVCGGTGSGKSTLLRLLKRELRPATGEIRGTVELEGCDDDLTAAARVGFVMQKPEQQIVTDKVWHELAFGLENLGVPSDEIRRRVAETAGWFGIEDWFERRVSELSGGQKQLLNLAAIMVMQPDILILDEPMSALDPIAATDFIDTLIRLNRETALTILVAEHRLDELMASADKLLLLDRGEAAFFGPVREGIGILADHPIMQNALPAPTKLSALLGEAPALTVREGRELLDNYDNKFRTPERETRLRSEQSALRLKGLCFRYQRESADILHDCELDVRCGEVFALLGGNGSGKSTLLSVIAGARRAYAGDVRVFGKKLRDYAPGELYDHTLALLPQDAQTLFLCNTVRAELKDAENVLPYDFGPLLDKHPYDLSGGEQQLLALAKTIATKPRLLLLDEPTQGLDAQARRYLADLMRSMCAGGMTILFVTHDPEFAVSVADRCALLFRGEVVSCDEPAPFFAGNRYYTTAAHRMSRGHYDGVVTVEEAAALARRNGRRV